jgi:hypothetical protein
MTSIDDLATFPGAADRLAAVAVHGHETTDQPIDESARDAVRMALTARADLRRGTVRAGHCRRGSPMPDERLVHPRQDRIHHVRDLAPESSADRCAGARTAL